MWCRGMKRKKRVGRLKTSKRRQPHARVTSEAQRVTVLLARSCCVRHRFATTHDCLHSPHAKRCVHRLSRGCTQTLMVSPSHTMMSISACRSRSATASSLSHHATHATELQCGDTTSATHGTQPRSMSTKHIPEVTRDKKGGKLCSVVTASNSILQSS